MAVAAAEGVGGWEGGGEDCGGRWRRWVGGGGFAEDVRVDEVRLEAGGGEVGWAVEGEVMECRRHGGEGRWGRGGRAMKREGLCFRGEGPSCRFVMRGRDSCRHERVRWM